MLSQSDCFVIIIVCCVVGILYAALNAKLVSNVRPFETPEVEQKLTESKHNLALM